MNKKLWAENETETEAKPKAKPAAEVEIGSKDNEKGLWARAETENINWEKELRTD